MDPEGGKKELGLGVCKLGGDRSARLVKDKTRREEGNTREERAKRTKGVAFLFTGIKTTERGRDELVLVCWAIPYSLNCMLKDKIFVTSRTLFL